MRRRCDGGIQSYLDTQCSYLAFTNAIQHAMGGQPRLTKRNKNNTPTKEIFRYVSVCESRRPDIDSVGLSRTSCILVRTLSVVFDDWMTTIHHMVWFTTIGMELVYFLINNSTSMPTIKWFYHIDFDGSRKTGDCLFRREKWGQCRLRPSNYH